MQPQRILRTEHGAFPVANASDWLLGFLDGRHDSSRKLKPTTHGTAPYLIGYWYGYSASLGAL